MPIERIKTRFLAALTHSLGHWCTQQENGLLAPKNSRMAIPHVSGAQAWFGLAFERYKIKTDPAHAFNGIGVFVPDSQVMDAKQKARIDRA